MADDRGPVGEEKEVQEDHKPVLREIFNWFSLTGFVYGPLDERLHFREALLQQFGKVVPRYRTCMENNLFACLGGITFAVFCVQVVTGILLAFYYRPTVDEAYSSVMLIQNQVPFGWLVRGLHFWAANVMIATVIGHMLRVYIVGAYKRPRDFNWVVGALLFMITLTFGFSGYLLPWSQISYWATTVGTEGIGAAPLGGPALKYLVRGGYQISQLTLSRFYALHVIVLPALAVLLLTMHFTMIRRLGISQPL